MTTPTKAVNWSDEVVAQLKAAYAENKDLNALALQFGKTVPALRSKLVSLGVYEKQEARAVGGASSVRKVQLVKQVAELMQVDFAKVESLEKANKEALEELIQALKASVQPEVAETETETETE